jgi:hypothetical protein
MMRGAVRASAAGEDLAAAVGDFDQAKLEGVGPSVWRKMRAARTRCAENALLTSDWGVAQRLRLAAWISVRSSRPTDSTCDDSSDGVTRSEAPERVIASFPSELLGMKAATIELARLLAGGLDGAVPSDRGLCRGQCRPDAVPHLNDVR